MSFFPPSIRYLIIRYMSVERPQPEYFHPFTAIQVYDLHPIVTYYDLTFEEILEVAAHYWHYTDAIGDASLLAAKLYMPRGNKEIFTVMMLNHAYFTGTIEYTGKERYSEYSTMATCFKYHENRILSHTTKSYQHTNNKYNTQNQLIQYDFHQASSNPKLATNVYYLTSNSQNGVTIPRNILANQ